MTYASFFVLLYKLAIFFATKGHEYAERGYDCLSSIKIMARRKEARE